MRSTPDAPPRTHLRFFKQVSADDPWIGSRNRLRPGDVRRFPGATLPEAFARALCERSALPAKELFEATETFQLVRSSVRRSTVADVCCGHGLVGLLFAVFEPSVETVLLLDRERPASADAVLDAARSVASWAVPKVHWREESLESCELPTGSGVIAVHACGLRTDSALDIALAAGGPFAALPCCRPHRMHPAPTTLKKALGADLAIDVHRTYRLEDAGYLTRWQEISETITPMNRVLSARPPR
jgi:hypothetical protein